MPILLPRAPRPQTHGLRLPVTAAVALTLLALGASCRAVRAQSMLPPLSVEATKAKAAPKAKTKAAAKAKGALVTAPDKSAAPVPEGSLTAPTTHEAEAELAKVAGAVLVVPDTAYKTGTPGATLKDVLGFVPGVFAQPKWGEDTRLSIRGSGLSRNFHLRGVQLYMDGIPINTADGYGDFQEIDPSAYRYVEVYKGGDALRYGANALGGAINFVMPTGYDSKLFGVSYDIGSFGFQRLTASAGGVKGPFDFFVTGSWLESEGFRDHSWGDSTRASLNLGYKISPSVETRFYLNANDIQQRIPGSVTKDQALHTPTDAFSTNALNDWQRDIASLRIANKTVIRIAPGLSLELGAFMVDRHLMHPIYQWLDYQYSDYGAFARVTSETSLLGFKNRLIAGLNVFNGEIDDRQYQNSSGTGAAVKGALLSSSLDTSQNTSAYIENSFFFLPDVALVTGTQFLHATRDRADRFFDDAKIDPSDTRPDDSGRTDFDIWSPKLGLLWNIGPTSQVFANLAWSAEVPSFGESSSVAGIDFTDIKAQTARTLEIGTRGQLPDLTWNVALYRALIDNELQCLYSSFGTCQVVNADHTVHQGVEVGVGAVVAKGMLAEGAAPDRLWLNLAYTLSDFRFDGDARYGDNELPGAPRHFIRAELLYKHPSGLFVGPNVEWVPTAYYVDSANTTKTTPYAIWGLKLGFDDGGPVSWYVEGRNLADTAYIASVSVIDLATPTSPLYEPGTGRSVFAGVKYRW